MTTPTQQPDAKRCAEAIAESLTLRTGRTWSPTLLAEEILPHIETLTAQHAEEVERLKKENQFLAILQPAIDHGWTAIVSHDCNCPSLIRLFGGDTNCHHPKHYDPNDGHGYTEIVSDDIEDDLEALLPDDDPGWSFETARLCVRAALAIEGKPRKHHRLDPWDALREEMKRESLEAEPQH